MMDLYHVPLFTQPLPPKNKDQILCRSVDNELNGDAFLKGCGWEVLSISIYTMHYGKQLLKQWGGVQWWYKGDWGGFRGFV